MYVLSLSSTGLPELKRTHSQKYEYVWGIHHKLCEIRLDWMHRVK